MNCIKGFSFIFSLYIIFSAFHIAHLAGKKEIPKEGTCYEWFEHAVEEPGPVKVQWSTEVKKRTCHICNPTNNKKSWLITQMVNTQGYKLMHADVDIFRRACKTCQNQDIKVSILKETLPTGDHPKSVEILNKLPVLTTLQNKEDDKSQTHHFQFDSALSHLSIVFLSEGSCTRVERIDVTSFACEQSVTMGIYLPRTVAPAVGFTRVNVSCPENALSPQNDSAYGLCSSNGTWNIISPCICKKGFTLAEIKERCKECQVNMYKNSVGNGKCNACPRNSKSDTGQHRCLCKDGFYRFIGDEITRPCHGIPSSVRNIKLVDKTENSVKLLWESPERSGAPDQDVLYDVECKKCRSVGNNKPCEDSCGTRVLYIPRQSNLTNTNVTVQNLHQNTEYQFVVYSKNLNSLRINKSSWENSKKKIKTEAKSKSSIATIIVSVLLCVIFFLIVSYGIVIYKRRHRTSKLSNSVSIPVDTVERELFAEQTQNSEEPRYVTPDKLSRARHEKTQILEPSTYAELDKNRQDPRDNGNYQKLLKPDSDYLMPDDGGTETYENV